LDRATRRYERKYKNYRDIAPEADANNVGDEAENIAKAVLARPEYPGLRAQPESRKAWRDRPELLVDQEPVDRIDLARQLQDGYETLEVPHLAELGDRTRVAALWARAKELATTQLGVPAAESDRARAAVIDGEDLKDANAITFASGLTTVHRALIASNDAAGAALAAAENPRQLLDVLNALAAGTLQAPGRNESLTERRNADASLFVDLAHEQWHSMRQQADAPPRPAATGDDIADARADAAWRLQIESMADDWSFELALLAHMSPLAVASHRLVRVFRVAQRGETGFRPSGDDDDGPTVHPGAFQRYRTMYRYFEAHKNAMRPDGEAYMTPAMQREFEMIPTPEQVKELVLRTASKARGWEIDDDDPERSDRREMFRTIAAGEARELPPAGLRTIQGAALRLLDRSFSDASTSDRPLKDALAERRGQFPEEVESAALDRELFDGLSELEQQQAALEFVLQTFHDPGDRALREAATSKLNEVDQAGLNADALYGAASTRAILRLIEALKDPSATVVAKRAQAWEGGGYVLRLSNGVTASWVPGEGDSGTPLEVDGVVGTAQLMLIAGDEP
jgi:hypothetical protein